MIDDGGGHGHGYNNNNNKINKRGSQLIDLLFI
jgi:hypothetical protein